MTLFQKADYQTTLKYLRYAHDFAGRFMETSNDIAAKDEVDEEFCILQATLRKFARSEYGFEVELQQEEMAANDH